MRKLVPVSSLLLFIIPIITLIICQQIVAYYYDFHTIPFVDGKISISGMGRGEKTIGIFRSGFFIYILISVFFYFQISDFFTEKEFRNKFKIYGILANLSLCVYLIALGKQESFYEISRRLSIIFYIGIMLINHIYLIKTLKFLKLNKKIFFKKIYLKIFYTIIFLMAVLAIIGLPWINPLFKYPNQLKNIVEWNYLFLTIFFYVPLSFLLYEISKETKKINTY